MDRDLIEKLLTAQVLALAAAMQAVEGIKNPHKLGGTDFTAQAIELIRRRQAEVIATLLAAPETAGG